MQALTLGTQGEEISLELTMRVVADLGLVVRASPALPSFRACSRKATNWPAL